VKKSARRVPLNEIENDGSALTLLLPGPDVLMLRAEIPAKSRQQVMRAAPYALEEQVAEEVENLHFVPGQREADGHYPVAVVARRVIASALARLAGWQVNRVLPSFLALPLPAQGWSVLAESEWVLLRTGTYSGFAVERANFAYFLSLALAESGAPEKIQVLQGDHEFALNPAQTQGIPLENRVHPHGALGWFAEGLAAMPASFPLNLRQGDFRQEDALALWWRPWRLSAALALLWLGIQGGAEGLAVARLEAQQQALRQQIEAAYREAFPDTRHLVNPRAQMEQQLAALRAAGNGQAEARGFLELLARLAGPLSQAEGGLLKRLDYRAPRLDLEMELATLQAWESLRQGLSAQGLAVETQYTNSRDNRVETRLRIEAGK
jgi:general secretion pathway protein L